MRVGTVDRRAGQDSTRQDSVGGPPPPSSRAAHLPGMASERIVGALLPCPSAGGACPPTTISRGGPISTLQRGEFGEKEDEKKANSWEQGQGCVLGEGEKSFQAGVQKSPPKSWETQTSSEPQGHWRVPALTGV